MFGFGNQERKTIDAEETEEEQQIRSLGLRKDNFLNAKTSINTQQFKYLKNATAKEIDLNFSHQLHIFRETIQKCDINVREEKWKELNQEFIALIVSNFIYLLNVKYICSISYIILCRCLFEDTMHETPD